MSQDKKTPESPSQTRSPGRVDVDSRGRNVWRWEAGQADSTSVVLKRLENDALQLEPTQAVPTVGAGSDKTGRRRRSDAQVGAEPDGSDLGLEQTRTVKSGGGFDPYDHSG